MATIRHERHLRYILLLGEGGTLVLQEILKREIKNSGKTLEELLIGYKSQIKQRTFSESFLKVYPQTGIPDETTWDISLLALIILELFGGSLTKDECQEIENIRKTRNNLAHTFSLSMDENEYDDSRKKLAATLLKLSDGLGRFIQDKCQNFIKQFDTGPIDIHAATERVKEFSRYDEHISKALWKITKNIADVKYQISDVQMDVKEVLRRMYLGDKEFSTFQVIGATISLKSSDDRLTRLVEETTKRVFKAALKKSGDKELTSKVVAAVQKILQEVEHFDGVAISDVETHCIRLTIRCKTCRGLLELLKYFESDSFKETLKELCSALEEEYHCRFIITVEITKESLEEIMNNLKKDMSESMEEEQYQKEDDLQNRQQVHHDNSSVKDFIVTDRKVKIIIPFRSSYENFERKCKTWFNIPEQIRVVFFVTVGDEEIQLDNDAIATQPRLTKLIIEENITGFSEHMKEKGAIKQSMSVGSTTTTIKEGLRKSQNINYKITHEQGIQQTDDRTEGIVSGDNGKDSVFSPLKKVTGEETSASASGCMSIPELDSDDEEILSLEKELDALEKDEIKLRKVKQKEELRQKVIQKRKEVNALKGQIFSDVATESRNVDEGVNDTCMAIDEGSAEDSTVIDEGKIEKTVEEYVDMALTSDEDLGKELLEDEDIKAHFLNYGLKNLHAVLQKALEKHDRTQLSIAIIGQTGTGKSSLINALMDLHSGEEGAAAVGEVGECTTNCKEYKHPKLPNLSFWDVPGVDSPKFPRMSYIEDIKVENYDFFLLVYSGRLKDSEIWLKSELDKLKKKCYFVYTKVDNDILSVTRREQNSKEEDVFMQLKSKSMNNMRKISSPGEVPKQFLISSLKPKSFDFPKLSEQLIDDAPDVKKLVLIYSVGANSKKIIEEKAKALRKRCWPVVLLRAFKLLTQVPAESKLLKLLDAVFDCLDIAYIIREITFYQEQFGLTDDNLEKITEFKQVSLSDLKSKLQLKTNSIQLNGDGLKALFHNSEAYLKQKVAQLGPTSFIESLVRITESHKFAECFLEMILDNMKEDALKVLEFITKGN